MRIDDARRKFALIDRRRRAFAGEIALPLSEWVKLMMLRHDVPSEAPWYPGIMLKVEKPIPLKPVAKKG